MRSQAVYSPCEQYRYWLSRTWEDGPTVSFVGLNPSTATEATDDPTVRRCRRFAERWGYGGFIMLNLFAFRATEPKEMKVQEHPVGSETDRYLLEGAYQSQEIVCCWGIHGHFRGRAAYVEKMLRAEYSAKLRYLRLVSGGTPGYPLYLPNSVKREVWNELLAR